MDIKKLFENLRLAEENFTVEKTDYAFIVRGNSGKYVEFCDTEEEALARAKELNITGHKTPDIEIEEDTIDIKDATPCVILIEDIGNSFAFVELVEKDTELKSQYDVNVEYQEEAEDLEPTLQYILAYYKDGEFYDENGENMYLDDINVEL